MTVVPGHLHVDHKVHVLRINAPSSEVSGAEDPGVKLSECLHHSHPPDWSIIQLKGF